MAPRQRILEEGAAIRVRGCSCLYPLEEEETSKGLCEDVDHNRHHTLT